MKLSFQNLNKVKFVKKNHTFKEIQVLKDISFNIEEKEIFAVIGPSGSGKTTLLRLINRLEEPTRGDILLEGKSILKMEVFELRRKIGMIFQVPALFLGTVEENLFYGLTLRKINRQDGQIRIKKYLSYLEIDEEILSRDINTLSLGQQQRVSILRTIILEPEVILMDEPTSSLDPANTNLILSLIKELNQKLGITIIYVTHLMEQAKILSHRSLVLINGEKVEEGETEKIFSSPAKKETQDFIFGKF